MQIGQIDTPHLLHSDFPILIDLLQQGHLVSGLRLWFFITFLYSFCCVLVILL